MSEICAFNSNPNPADSTDGQSGPFNTYEWGSLVWMTNLFNASANGGFAPTGVSACFDLPIDGGPANLPDNRACYSNNGIIDDQPCIISYTGDFTNSSAVRGYPAVILGSRQGCKETYGVMCGDTPVLMDGFRNNADGLSSNNCDIYDLTVSQAATGYPAFVGSTPATIVNLDYRDCGDSGTNNVFTDIYLHDVADVNLIPQDAAGNPITSLQNTINGISGRDTAMWNVNIWYETPTNLSNPTGGTGTPVATGISLGGCTFDIYLKHETGGNNNFAYLGFVMNPSKSVVSLDTNALIDWVSSPATGPGTFITEVYNSPEMIQICQDMANPTNSAVPKTCRPPDNTMVMDSVQVGIEMWGTDDGGTAAVCFDTLNFDVEGIGVFGKSVSLSSCWASPEEGCWWI